MFPPFEISTEISPFAVSARTKFMIETLVNLKNSSKTRSLPGAEAGAEATRRMKKYLGGLGKKRTSQYSLNQWQAYIHPY
jgi:hypothetical protein